MTYDNIHLEGRRTYAIALGDKAIARRDTAATAERALADIAPGPRYGAVVFP
ncbi:hypothetical protein [Nocardia miyunensis]|uniref:hypothetical protein n=1 Tax=Nocardia miyunensis TaxID=282684 RepID=UPI000A3E0D19|nr:hypothetical protein [Nocardia miyunensis]